MKSELKFSIIYGKNRIGLYETLVLPDESQISPIPYDEDKLSLLPSWVDKKQPNYSIYLMDSARNEPYKGGWTFEQRFEDYCNRLPDADPVEVLRILTAPSGNLDTVKLLALDAVVTK